MRLAHKNRYQPKHLARSGDGADIYRALAPSVIGMALCAACLSGTTWAWFTATATTEVATIQAGSYNVSVTTAGATSTVVDGSVVCTYSSATSETVTLTPDTTVSAGYCTIEFQGNTYYTPQLTSDSFTFTVNANAEDTLKVTPSWGESKNDVTLSANGVIGATITPASVDEGTTPVVEEEAEETAEQSDSEVEESNILADKTEVAE